jgi:hypothetical protein
MQDNDHHLVNALLQNPITGWIFQLSRTIFTEGLHLSWNRFILSSMTGRCGYGRRKDRSKSKEKDWRKLLNV